MQNRFYNFLMLVFIFCMKATSSVFANSTSEDEPMAIGYRYCLDNNYKEMKEYSCQNGDLTLSIDYSTLTVGIHTLNLQIKNKKGIWSNLNNYNFYVLPTEESTTRVKQPIVAYKYGFNGNIIKEENIEETNDFSITSQKVDLPNILDVAKVDDAVFTFASNEVKAKRNTDVFFHIQFKNKEGIWSTPYVETTNIEDSIAKAPHTLVVNNSIDFTKVKQGDFEVIKFTIESAGSYYFSASQACNLRMFDENGNSLGDSISAKSLKATYVQEMATGVYYGIIYNMKKDANNTQKELSFRLSNTDKFVVEPNITYANHKVTLSCEQEGVKLYYTLDGSVPTVQSTEYSEPFVVQKNYTVKAIAICPNFANSHVASYQIEDFKTETPQITFSNLKVHITTATEGAKVYYTIDDSEPTEKSSLYTEPFTVNKNCKIRAIAIYDGYNNSDVAEYVLNIDKWLCAKPILTRTENTLTMSTTTEGASIYYTTDGSEPSTNSIKYAGPILLSRNNVYRAITAKDQYISSEYVELIVNDFKANKVTYTFADEKLSISSTTPGAVIHYEIGGKEPTEDSPIYNGVLTLEDNRPVKMIVYADGFNTSDAVTYQPTTFTCAKAETSYDGRTIKLTTTTKDAKIYYTLDDTEPTDVATLYDNQAEGITLDTIHTVKAIVIKDWMNNSDIVTYNTPYYYNGQMVTIKEAGTLSKAFDWNGGKPQGSTLAIVGNINAADIQTTKSYSQIRTLDISKVNIAGNKLEDKAFAGANFIVISLPASLTNYGEETLAGCKQLAAIYWNANAAITAEVLSGIDNPNLLLYVNTKSYAPASVNNVVAGGIADNIVLSEPSAEQTSTGNFYAPQAFTAKKISYTRDFKQETEIGVCQGWETISLPFDAQTITHETNGNIAPFAKGDKEARPFWLYELAPNGGFQATATIKANTPYIISMPNSQAYSDEYILGGKVTFSASDVNIEATEQASTKNNSREFVTSFEQIGKQNGVYALNVGQEYQGYRPGSIFTENFVDVKPFEAYLTTAEAAAKFSSFFNHDDSTTGIDDIPTKQMAGLNVWTNGSTLYIRSDKARTVQVFSTTGMLVKSVKIEASEIQQITSLPAGIYIVNKKKVAVR